MRRASGIFQLRAPYPRSHPRLPAGRPFSQMKKTSGNPCLFDAVSKASCASDYAPGVLVETLTAISFFAAFFFAGAFFAYPPDMAAIRFAGTSPFFAAGSGPLNTPPMLGTVHDAGALNGVFLAVTFLAGLTAHPHDAVLAGAFLAGVLEAVFLTGAFFAAVFLVGVFLAAGLTCSDIPGLVIVRFL